MQDLYWPSKSEVYLHPEGAQFVTTALAWVA